MCIMQEKRLKELKKAGASKKQAEAKQKNQQKQKNKNKKDQDADEPQVFIHKNLIMQATPTCLR